MHRRTFVMGDIHGHYQAFKQCLERCSFNIEYDLLIQLGDVSDRHPETALVVEALLKITNLIAIRGNHDEWTRKWLATDEMATEWVTNGGKATIESYSKSRNEIDIDSHKNFFELTQQNYFIDDENRIFVHGGFTHPNGPEYDLVKSHCLWDRSLWNDVIIGKKLNRKPTITNGFKEIFIGHTPTLYLHQDQPMNAFNVWNLDTGIAFNGRLSIMDIETKEFWQSDLVEDFNLKF
jgi:serine/threonine protein phosphatase 1